MKKEMKNPISDDKEDEEGNISDRVSRGGSWYIFPEDVSVSDRSKFTTKARVTFVGFRIVRNK